MEETDHNGFEKDVAAHFNGKYKDGILHWDFDDCLRADQYDDLDEIAAEAIRCDTEHCCNFNDYNWYLNAYDAAIDEEASEMFRAKSKELNLYCGKEDNPFSSFDSLAKHYGFESSAEMAEAFYEKAEYDHVKADYTLPSVDCQIMLDLGARNRGFT